MMKRLLILLVSVVLAAPTYYTQPATQRATKENELTETQLIWLNDLKTLELESAKLEGALARALAKAEIAAAAWDMDKAWSKQLLRKAYDLTLPEEEEQRKLREKPAGSMPVPPTSKDRARNSVSRRVLQVASRDRLFANELAQLSKEKLGNYEAHIRYTNLANQALSDGDKESAGKFLLQAIEADPTQVAASLMIKDLAARDRALADNLILQYIERLRASPLSNTNQSLGRAFFILNSFVFPQSTAQHQVTPPGPAVMRAYVSFAIDTVKKLQDDPANQQAVASILRSTWPFVRQYAPDLTGAFLALEQRSPRASDDGSQTRDTVDEMYRAHRSRNDQRIDNAVESDKPDQDIIALAINQSDFVKARRMIDKLSDDDQKTKLIEIVNAREALDLVAKDDIPGAQSLAERLTTATSILAVYPAIVNKCVSNKDQAAMNDSVRQAIKHLKRAGTTLPKSMSSIGIPAAANDSEIDFVLVTLSKLGKAIIPVNETLGWEVLDELVQSANRSKLDTTEGRTGFESDLFKVFAKKNDERAYQVASGLKDRLERIVALATIYQELSEAYIRSSTRDARHPK